MWLGFALVSALFLGLYDVSKKQSLKDNAVIPVLWFNTLFCSLLMLPFTLLSWKTGVLDGSIFYVPTAGWELHRLLMIKAFIVLGSWIFGYFGMKHLPITLFGPINATRPIIVLLGGLLLFGERLNLYQWIGVIIAVISFYLLSVSGRKEGITFYRNTRWWPTRKRTSPFQWKWPIIFIAVFLTLADYAYFVSLASSASMVSIVSMIRRSSVIVSFLCGALLFHEKNLKSKIIDLLLVLLGLFFLLIGSLQ